MSSAVTSPSTSFQLQLQKMFFMASDSPGLFTTQTVLQHASITIIFVIIFLFTKSACEHIRRSFSKLTVVVVGGGPIGLLSVLIASRTEKIGRIILYEERCRYTLISRPQQICLDSKSIAFLKSLGVDFDSIEGCWGNHNQKYFARIGMFQDYLLTMLDQLDIPLNLRLNTKFTKDTVAELERFSGRVLVIVADGVNGTSAKLLGFSDDFTQKTCKFYGAVAAIDRKDQRQLPAPEIRVHGLTFDLCAFYGKDFRPDDKYGFHLKIFGSYRHRYMSLSIPKCDSPLVKTLRVSLDQSIMRNIFKECFNHYKSENESKITDLLALKSLKFSPRLFEIKLSWRKENVLYIEDDDIVVICEGDAMRSLNFHSGMDINLSIQGLDSLETFISQISSAHSRACLIESLNWKSDHAIRISEKYIKNGLWDSMHS